MKDETLTAVAKEMDATGPIPVFKGKKPTRHEKHSPALRPAFLFLLLFGIAIGGCIGLPLLLEEPDAVETQPSIITITSGPLPSSPPATQLLPHPTATPIATVKLIAGPPAAQTAQVKAWISMPAKQPVDRVPVAQIQATYAPQTIPSKQGGTVPAFTVEHPDVVSR